MVSATSKMTGKSIARVLAATSAFESRLFILKRTESMMRILPDTKHTNTHTPMGRMSSFSVKEGKLQAELLKQANKRMNDK